MRRTEPGAVILAALAGASGWISLGTLAVMNDRGVRLGAVPEAWVAVALIVTAVGLAFSLRLKTAAAWPLALCGFLWLPWLPARIPAALLAWEGPLESLIWAAAALGLLRALPIHWAPRLTTWLMDRTAAPRLAAALSLIGALSGAMLLEDRLPAGDEPHYLILTQSLLHDGDLRIQNNHERGEYLDYFPDGLDPDFLRRGQDGEIYSIHTPGISALVLPAFAIAGYPGAVAFVALVCAAGFAIGWRASADVTGSPAAAWVAWTAVVFSAPVFFHSFTIFPDGVAAAIVSAEIWILLRLDDGVADCSSWLLGMMGGALAVLPWLHTRFALIAGMFALIVVVRLLQQRDVDRSRDERQPASKARPLRTVFVFFAAPLVSTAVWLAYFWSIYGTVDPSSPYGNSQQQALEWMAPGLVGLLFDQQFGLVAGAPVMMFVPYGLALLARRRPRLALELVLVLVPYVLAVASFGMWWGGHSAPARLLACILPVGFIALACAWHYSNTALRAALVLLVALGVINVIARTVLLKGTLLYNTRDGHDLLLDWLSQTVNIPLALPSFHRSGPWGALLDGIVWLGAGAIALGVLVLRVSRWRLGTGARWAVTAAFAILASNAAMSLVWQAGRERPLTPESSRLAFLRRWHPTFRPLAVELPRVRVSPVADHLRGIELVPK